MKLNLQFDEVFDHPVDALWRAITDRRILGRWLMENDFEPRVGHAFTLRDPPTADWRGKVACTVLELDPPWRMVWSWNGGMDGETETRVVFELSSESAGTRLVFRHEGEAAPSRSDALGNGWTRRLAILRAVLEPAYARRVAFGSAPERVFDAVATLDGLRQWWTPRVTGSASAGGDLRFEFEGLEEHVVMHVDRMERSSSVHWTCVEHTRLEDWKGTRVLFDLAPRGPGGCDLTFRHVGLTPALDCYEQCDRGWDHFLASLVAYVDQGEGSPFGRRRGDS
jgi:uncharacterized protein YndB with AHSA1/START domain